MTSEHLSNKNTFLRQRAVVMALFLKLRWVEINIDVSIVVLNGKKRPWTN